MCIRDSLPTGSSEDACVLHVVMCVVAWGKCAVQCSAVQCSARSAVQCSAVQCSAAQRSAAQRSAA
eukprot:2505038-Alexandrium_andersonii.AAC.1